MPDKQLARLHRVTDLFVSGREIVLDSDPEDPVLIWVNKLNAFQRSDAQRDGSAGQTRRMAALGDDSEEVALLRKRISGYTEDQLLDAILAPRTSEFYLAGRDDVQADADWKDRLVLVERGEALARDGSYSTPDEAAAVADTNSAYLAAVEKAANDRRAAARADLAGQSRAELENEYIEAYRRLLGFDAFQDEYARTEAWYALRDCTATRVADTDEVGEWDHTKCTHLRLLPSRAAVAELPEGLLDRVQNALTQLNMPPSTAGNSAAPRTSSASSEQPSSAEDSTPSTPVET